MTKASREAARQRRLAREAERAARDETIIELRERGLSYSQIATQMGIDMRQVHRSLVAHEMVDHSKARPGPYPQETWDRVEKFLREEGASYTEASRTFGPGVKQIQNRFPDLGWTRQEAGRFQGQINGIMMRNRRSSTMPIVRTVQAR